jgi:transposase
MLEGVNGKEDWIVEESVFVGIDVSKATLDIVMRPGGSRESIPNQEAQIGELVRRLSTLRVTLLVVEATGGIERRIVRALAAAELPVIVVNPRQVRDFAKASGRLAKTDKIDAEVSAHFGEAIRPALRTLPGPANEELRAQIARRRQVTEMLTAETDRLGHSAKAVGKRIQAHIRWLEGGGLIELIANLIRTFSRARSGASRKTCSRACLESDPSSVARCWLSCRSWESLTENRSLHWWVWRR